MLVNQGLLSYEQNQHFNLYGHLKTLRLKNCAQIMEIKRMEADLMDETPCYTT